MRIKRNTRTVEEIPLASTADIAFLLIVFFLAASALLEMRGVRIPVPKKDAPPMEILKKNIFQIDINDKGELLSESKSSELEVIKNEVVQRYKNNKELVVLIKVSPESPVFIIPEVIQMLQEQDIPKISINMRKGQ